MKSKPVARKGGPAPKGELTAQLKAALAAIKKNPPKVPKAYIEHPTGSDEGSDLTVVAHPVVRFMEQTMKEMGKLYDTFKKKGQVTVPKTFGTAAKKHKVTISEWTVDQLSIRKGRSFGCTIKHQRKTYRYTCDDDAVNLAEQ